MAKKEKDDGYVLFTQRDFGALGDIGSLARGIAAGQNSRFRTATISHQSGAVGRDEWFEAWFNPASGYWAVTRWEKPRDAQNKDQPAFSNLAVPQACFFDALHYCAFQESGAGKLAAIVLPSEDEDCPYYKDVAAQLSIPLDIDGLPHVAANGVILTKDGAFDDEARKTAARTKGVAWVPVKPPSAASNIMGSLSVGLVSVSQGGDKGSGLSVKDMMEEQNLVQVFQEVAQATENTMEVFRASMQNDFGDVKEEHIIAEPSFYVTAASVAGLLVTGIGVLVGGAPVLVPLICAGVGGIGFSGFYWSVKAYPKATRQFQKAHEKMQARVKKIPDDQPEKKLMQDFTVAAAASFNLEKAAAIHREYVVGTKKVRDLKEGTKLIAGALRLMGRTEKEIAALQTEYLKNRFAKQGTFSTGLEKSYTAVKAVLNARIARSLSPQ